MPGISHRKKITCVIRSFVFACMCNLDSLKSRNDGNKQIFVIPDNSNCSFFSKGLIHLVTFPHLFRYLILQSSLWRHVFLMYKFLRSFSVSREKKNRLNVGYTVPYYWRRRWIILEIYVSRTHSHIFRLDTRYLISLRRRTASRRLAGRTWHRRPSRLLTNVKFHSVSKLKLYDRVHRQMAVL
jgi:hypothetical protein